MSLHPRGTYRIPEMTRRVAHAAFPRGTVSMQIAHFVGTISRDEPVAARFPQQDRRRDQPGGAVWRR